MENQAPVPTRNGDSSAEPFAIVEAVLTWFDNNQHTGGRFSAAPWCRMVVLDIDRNLEKGVGFIARRVKGSQH